MTLFLVLCALPLLVALSALLVQNVAHVRVISALGGVAQAVSTLWVAVPVLRGEGRPVFLSWFEMDGMAAWMASVNAVVYGAAMLSAALLMREPSDLRLSDKGAKAMFGLMALVIVAANAVICATDLGAMWVAMEATTLVTAPLILLSGSRKSIEAAWKYLILCGVGIAFALLGTMLLFAASGSNGSLNIAWLMDHAATLKKSLLQASFVFLVLGYGTKAGLFPVHNWLPDAYSEAPAPASALISGALLNCAMVALWRIGGIVELSGSKALLIGVLVPMGAASVLAAGIMLVRQQNLKRMWAYSSIENVGLLVVAVGLRAGPVFALHALAHSLAKSSAFLLSGNLLRAYGTVTLKKLSGVMRRFPSLGFAVLAAGAAVMGAPPFASFVSEWLLLSRAADLGLWWIVVALVAGLALSFIAVLVHLGQVVFGEQPERAHGPEAPGSILPAVILLVGSAITFLAVSPEAIRFLEATLSPGRHP